MFNNNNKSLKTWFHSPAHNIKSGGMYILTAATYKHIKIINTPERLDYIQEVFFDLSVKYNWILYAWSFLVNHYHIIFYTNEPTNNIKLFTQSLHSQTSVLWNKQDNTPNRKIWFNYWESLISNNKSFFARLRYVQDNPELHKVVKNAEYYKWCSKKYFLEQATKSYQNKINTFKVDMLYDYDIKI